MKARIGWKALIKKKMKPADGHYAKGLVAGAKVLELFGDAATQLCLRESGFEGLFRAYHSVEFLAPIYVGDTVTVTATVKKIGNTSRVMSFKAVKSKSKKNILVAEALGTVVIPELKARS